MYTILDQCCGGRSFWNNPRHPHTVYGDRRQEQHTVTDQSHGKIGGTRQITIAPDVLWDFRALPFADKTFHLVVFDPPHLARAGQTSYMRHKYGVLDGDWRITLAQGFAEAFRVLKPSGVLNFKWNDTHIPLAWILPLAGRPYLYAQKRQKTHWIMFMKEECP
jgi:SAM-dependent methyltransferase